MAMTGSNRPHSYFLKKLSAKLRNTRYLGKKRTANSQLGPEKRNGSKKLLKATFVMPGSDDLTEEEYEMLIQEINNESLKSNADHASIMVALRKTFKRRRIWLQNIPTGQVNSILSKFGIFSDINYVSITIS